jgi:RNA polymerase sigma-70 factor, ECF subfamily
MNSDSNTNEFVTLYANNQRRIYAYIRSQVLSPIDADDVLQDTSAVLWQKFGDYRPGTDFARWACTIARLKVLAYHRHHKRLLSIFDQEAVDAIGEKVLELSDTVAMRAQALAECMRRLSPVDRDVLKLRYELNQSVSEIAQKIHRTDSAVYKSLQRIHSQLYECIENALLAQSKS